MGQVNYMYMDSKRKSNTGVLFHTITLTFILYMNAHTHIHVHVPYTVCAEVKRERIANICICT